MRRPGARCSTPGSTRRWRTAAAQAEFGFVTVAREGDRPVGSSRFLALRPADRGVEIGWTLVSPEAWGTGANTEAKLLMLTHAFEQLGCARVEFKTDARNERARAALAALPSTFEGIFRKHMLMFGGRWRDSAWYAITDDDWPRVRERLSERLAAQLDGGRDQRGVGAALARIRAASGRPCRIRLGA